MQKTLCSLALIASTTLPALAADSVEVKVIGTIKPVACTPSIAGGGVMDFGVIDYNELKKDDYTVIGDRTADFTITCNAPTKLAIQAINNRKGTLAGATENVAGASMLSSVSPTLKFWGASTYYAVGLGTSDGAKIGGYSIRIADTSEADGVKVDNLYSLNQGSTWAYTVGYPGLYSYVANTYTSWAEKGKTTPIAFERYAGKLEIFAYVNKASELNVNQPITLNGSTTLELVYL
ncbi:hypothetical protein IV04_02555 [Serratia sp. Ag1]|nr:hypothetical protein JV45_07765 [Serratia sp. Ag2]KFL00342.1 hypothetical protein IV04_02555 [Serratia sp. Ag1]